MPKPRLALIGSGPEISWISCQSISQNLIHSYTMLEQEYDICFYHLTAKTGSKVISRLKSFSPNKIIFYDHLPHYFLILKDLDQLWPQKKPELLFHIYGDFSLYLDLWIQHQKLLKKWRVHFLCASPRYMDFVSLLMKEQTKNLRVCPFPVDTKAFLFNPESRATLRKKFKIKSDDKVWLYVGRLSLQKNIDRLIREFSISCKTRKNQKLVLIGDVDDLGLFFLGHKAPLGYTYQLLQRTLKECAADVCKNIMHIPHSSLETVSAWYSAADAFCSLSLYHDEDFGMAPAEALSSGLSVVLSDWGGYSQFAAPHLKTHLVPIRLIKDGYLISSKTFQRAINTCEISRETEQRWSRAHTFAKKFGIAPVSEIIHKILQEQTPLFKGFNTKAILYPEEIRTSLQYPITSHSYYQNLYGESLG
jgi:glycosyltransferase involved in cell wall biosynthesis